MQKHPLLEREERAYQRVIRFKDRIRQAYEYILPMMTHDLDEIGGDAAPERPAVTDSTATEAAFAYADRFMTRYTPPNERFIGLWPGIAFEFFAPAQLDEVRQMLDRTMEMFHRLLEISNFHQTVHRAYLDYAISAGCLNFGEKANPNDPFSFESVPLPQITPEEGPQGTAKTSFRRFRILPQNVLPTWPDAKLPEELARKIGKPEEGRRLPELFIEALVWDSVPDRYDYVVVWKEQGKELVRRRVSPGARILFRNMLPSGAVFGIGPGLRQLPNIRQLNKAIEVQAFGDEFDAQSVYEAPFDHPFYSMGGTLDLAPGLVIPRGPAGGGLEPLKRTGAGRAMDVQIDRLQGQIRAAFNDDGLPPIGGKVLSPTEIMQRTRNELESFEPAATRCDSELLRPLARRGIEIMQRQGIIPPLRIDGLRVRIMADGPLARLRRQNEARSKLSWYGEVTQALGAEVVFGASDAPAFAADELEDGGIEPEFVLDEQERADRHQQMLEEQAMLAAQQGQAA